MPETPNTNHENHHFTNHIYQTTQTRGHTYHTTLFRMTSTSHKQQGFHHRGSPMLDGSLYGTFPHEQYTDALNNSNITANHLEAISFGQARDTIYEGSLLLSVMIE